MSHEGHFPADIKQAADAVVEFALVSLQTEFLLWEKNVNLGVAELVWNAHTVGVAAPQPPRPDSALADLFERLNDVRRRKWAKDRFLVFGLDVRHEDGDVLFTFDLTFDEGRTFHPCEIAWDFRVAGPAQMN